MIEDIITQFLNSLSQILEAKGCEFWEIKIDPYGSMVEVLITLRLTPSKVERCFEVPLNLFNFGNVERIRVESSGVFVTIKCWLDKKKVVKNEDS